MCFFQIDYLCISHREQKRRRSLIELKYTVTIHIDESLFKKLLAMYSGNANNNLQFYIEYERHLED